MRALPLLAALCLLSPEAPAAPGAPSAPSSSSSPGAPTLLVLRAACAARDPDAFSENRLRQHAYSRNRSEILRRPVRLLSYADTCGPDWRAKVTREALATVSSGGHVALAGWVGSGACALVRSGAAAACARPHLRSSAAAALAARLRWLRALLPPAPPHSACEAVLRQLRHDLLLAGLAVSAAPLPDDIANPPQVMVVCGRRRLAETGARPAVLLLREDELGDDAYDESDIMLDVQKMPYLKNIENSTPTPLAALSENANLSLFYPGTNKKSFPSPATAAFVNNVPRNKRTRYGVEAEQSTTSKAVFQVARVVNTIKSDSGYDSLRNNSSIIYIVRAARRARGNELKGGPAPRRAALERLATGLDATLRGRLLLLTTRDFDGDSSPASLVEDAYDEVIDAVQRDADPAKVEIKQTFVLYERIDDGARWRRVAELEATARVDEGEWVASAHFRNDSVELDRWSEKASDARGAEAAADAERGSAVSLPVLAASLAAALGAAAALALAARAVAQRRRRRRRRGDAVLAPGEFAFPADERRRVGEGMETMLSCWLQQLHEFGGPELERPDLLKQPAPPPAPSAPSSTCSINRLALDRRTRYKGDAVFMKYLPTSVAVELKRKATDLLIVMQGLRHENLNPFIGCLCEARPALVFDHCGRGSLEDVLMADEIKLDWTFRLSLLTDLVKGMRYLHASPLRVHGRLSSRNCVVDSRWVLRLTDYGLPAFHRAQGLPYPHRPARELLWTAPELLREGRAGGAGGAVRGSQPGDVFSFAIVMQEVIVRGEPYCMLALTPEEIVEKVMRPPPLIRPSVSMGAAPPEAVSVMRQCWSEAPDLRPDFNRLHDIFRHLHRGRKINIVDSMFEMLEKYSNNLEDLIRERTEQLDMEKKKTEQLLNRMLPRSVAERLLLGSRVEPEEFEEVSIYFSDIVGFTALAARSTPVQVVDLLNDLYTTFDAAIEQYQVYKVETIGDAYMVVGGLPVRSAAHAESVATMALHLLHLAGRFRVRHLPGTPLRLRIGLHTGPCCAAVVGLTMPRYCLFGDTVNTASRMESTGAAWRIQVSAATAARLAAAGAYRLRSRGLTQIKGKGAMHTYWLLGKEGFDKPLPTPPPLESEEVLVETDGENESKSPSPAPESPASPASPASPVRAAIERQRSDPSAGPDKYAWQRSGAASADSSPPRARADHSAPYARYRCLGGSGARVLRRQWSLERGDALAAAAGAQGAAAGVQGAAAGALGAATGAQGAAAEAQGAVAAAHGVTAGAAGAQGAAAPAPGPALAPVAPRAPPPPRYRTRPDPPAP